MSALSKQILKKYLQQQYEPPIEVMSIIPLGGMHEVEFILKDYGYGTPLQIKFTSNKTLQTIVLNTVKPGPFGHQTLPDRAAILLRQYQTFNKLPRHVKSIDIGAFTQKGSFLTLRDVKEVFLITEYVEGREYFHDLDLIKATGKTTSLDNQRVHALAEYLSAIHGEKHDDPKYYGRRTRELIGHNECLMGLTDSYPMDHKWITPSFLAEIEKKCIDWRWRLKTLTHRLSTVHGDFHPFNILFRQDTDFTALDRSRGSMGEPADDVAGLTINYIFWGLLHKKQLTNPFKELWEKFYDIYLEKTNDEELLKVIPPYLTWRALVVASPIWYPNYSLEIRKKLLNFATNILDLNALDPYEIDPLMEESE
jgi:hypothetical protein